MYHDSKTFSFMVFTFGQRNRKIMVNVGGFSEGTKPDEAVQALVEGVKGDVEKVGAVYLRSI